MLWYAEEQAASFQDYVCRKKKEYGAKFKQDDLNPDFIKAYDSQQRVKVDFGGIVKTGRIGITTGWRPCFLLMLRRDVKGSSWLIGDEAKIIT